MENKPTLYQKGRYQLKYRGVECTNCGHPLDMSDRFCPNCSQANSIKKLTLKDFFDEFFSTLISYDSKLLKTLTALLVYPGRITRDYLSGKRVSYTNPFRFLLSLGIVYFLMLSFGTNFQKANALAADENGSWIGKDGKLNLNFGSEANVDEKELSKILDTLAISEKIRKSDSIMLNNPKKHLDKLSSRGIWDHFTGKREFFNTVFEYDSIHEYDVIIKKFEMENSRTNRAAFSAATSFKRFKKQPGNFLSSMITKVPFVVFFFLPVFALFIWLVYIRKKYNYTDHLIFSFHNQSLLFILLIISFVIDAIFNVYTSWIFILIFGIYLFIAMKKFYNQSAIKTLLKFMFLNFAFFILAFFAILIFIVGGVFTY